MTRKEFIELLKELCLPYEEYTENGADIVWVFSRKEYEEKKKHPRKNKNLFVPYLRVSHFYEEDRWYTRCCGFTGYWSPDHVVEVVSNWARA